MIRKNVRHFDNVFGRPIEVLIVETETQLYISLRRFKHINLKGSSNIRQEPEDEYSVKQNGSLKIDKELNQESQSTQRDFKRIFGSDDEEYLVHHSTDDRKLIKLITFFIIAILLIVITSQVLLIVFDSFSLGAISASVLILVSLIHLCPRSDYLLTKESLLIFRDPLNSSLLTEKNQSHILPYIEEGSKFTNAYFFYLKKYCLGRTERQVLPLRNLSVSEIMKGGKIKYSLVVKSGNYKFTSSTECNSQPSHLNTNPMMMIEQNRTIANCQASSKKEKSFTSQEFEETIIFDHTSPKLDCIEYIISRIKAHISY